MASDEYNLRGLLEAIQFNPFVFIWGDISSDEGGPLSEQVYYYYFYFLLEPLRDDFPMAQMLSFPSCIICEKIER